MSDKFKGKYRISSARLPTWDYGWDGAYFITICTKNRECYFGEVIDEEMQLSHAGLISEIMWYEIKNHAKNVTFGAYQIMPNHMHGILILEGNADRGVTIDERAAMTVDTRNALSLRMRVSDQTIGQRRFQNPGKNTISSICGGYKSSVTKHCNRLGIGFGWQPLFHDHIIRDQGEYDRITNYIESNPKNWKGDKFNKDKEL